MRSLIILEVEHDETTDGVQMFTEYVMAQANIDNKWDDIFITNYTVKIGLPECFVLETT